jgi:hypothetical protein
VREASIWLADVTISKGSPLPSVTPASVLAAGVAGLDERLAHGAGAEASSVVAATVTYAVSWMALTASGLEPSLGESLGPGDDGEGEGLGDTDALGLGDGGGEADGCGCDLVAQLGDADGLRAADPAPPPERNGDSPSAAPPLCPAGPGPPDRGCELELLGDTAVEASIATYVPAATMNMTAAIAASGRSQPSVRERCLPGVGTGAKRSAAARSSAATR